MALETVPAQVTAGMSDAMPLEDATSPSWMIL
jgi:hypothetical protein